MLSALGDGEGEKKGTSTRAKADFFLSVGYFVVGKNLDEELCFT
jgi:hypothetical protein